MGVGPVLTRGRLRVDASSMSLTQWLSIIRIIPGHIKLCLFFAWDRVERAVCSMVRGSSDLKGGASCAVSGATRNSQQSVLTAVQRSRNAPCYYDVLQADESIATGDFYTNTAGKVFQFIMRTVYWLARRFVIHIKDRCHMCLLRLISLASTVYQQVINH